MHLQHMTLMVNNLGESIEFYETITELTISRRFQSRTGRNCIYDKWKRRN